VGPFYDSAISRYKDEVEEEGELAFVNPDDPVILDGWDPWTVVASLIMAGYIRLWEKYPTWSAKQKKQGCAECRFYKKLEDGTPYCEVWQDTDFEMAEPNCPYVTTGAPYLEYHEVQPDEIADPSFKGQWRPIEARTKEYIHFRNGDGK